MARTGASERGAIFTNVAALGANARFLMPAFKGVLTSIRDTGRVLMQSGGTHPLRRALAPALPCVVGQTAGWVGAGVLALLCSTVGWASLPRVADTSTDEQRQWQALGIAPLSSGGETGMRMAATDAVEPIAVAPKRAAPFAAPTPAPPPQAAPSDSGPLRIRGTAGEGL